ncbi:glycosyltransferase family 4 protein [Micromonospora sagamiensis]|uniref:Glycosyltransferase involved in cell wall biosynthesis n=1 Tax=Micromonospora sagamiensis TaxID=47875 RepID=A0A562WPM6_9ACTN|nr:glycosyltransferase family 4 protein [Micromonospora sagamiensis]TWJ32178.1 glycosyltransferase involved in cell wall biosynthesis [Micromonospora sagamiensis]BCL14763.1 glycosyl transferase [Micromonospora sagamiensis]
MKIVVAHNRYRQAQPSGENTIVDAEIAQLRAAGVEVLPFIRSSDEIPTMPKTAKALLPISPIYAPRAQQDLSRLLTEHKPDVLHLHNPYPLLSPWVVRTAHRHGVPVVQTVHNYRQVCSSGVYFRDGAICQDCKGRTLGVPAIRNRCYRGSTVQSALMAATLAVHRPTWRSVDRFIALTSQIAEHLREYGIPADRIVVKPNGIPDPGRPAPLGEGFFYLGRLSPEKGLGLLLDAWRRHPDGALGPLRIAGDGELRHLAEQAAAERSDVTYLGSLDRDGVRAVMAQSAVVIAASLWHDVLPTVVIEAMASGRPVLGTDLGGIPYLVGADDPAGAVGWVVPADPAAMAAALPVAAAGAAALSAPARLRYERTFHPDVVTKRLIDVYAGLRGGIRS